MSALPSQQPGLIERHGLTRADVEHHVWAIEPGGRRFRGSAAIARLLGEMGGGWRVLGWAVLLPGAGLIYALVDRTRGRLGAVWGDRPPCPD